MIRKLWRGNYAFLTYWVFYVVVGIALNVIIAAAEGLLASARTLDLVAFFLLLAIGLAYYPLVCVGIWRSASKYQGRMVWAVLAKVHVVLGILANVVLFLSEVTW